MDTLKRGLTKNLKPSCSKHVSNRKSTFVIDRNGTSVKEARLLLDKHASDEREHPGVQIRWMILPSPSHVSVDGQNTSGRKAVREDPLLLQRNSLAWLNHQGTGQDERARDVPWREMRKGCGLEKKHNSYHGSRSGAGRFPFVLLRICCMLPQAFPGVWVSTAHCK